MDTASSTLGLCLHMLSQHPHSYRRAQAEARSAFEGRPLHGWTASELQSLPFVTACIKEVLRLFPAAPFVGRVALRDTVVHGQAIAQGELCFLDLLSVHMHEDFWPCHEVSCLLGKLLQGRIQLIASRGKLPQFESLLNATCKSLIGRITLCVNI